MRYAQRASAHFGPPMHVDGHEVHGRRQRWDRDSTETSSSLRSFSEMPMPMYQAKENGRGRIEIFDTKNAKSCYRPGGNPRIVFTARLSKA